MSAEASETYGLNCHGQKELGYLNCIAELAEETELGRACVHCLVPAVVQVRSHNMLLEKQNEHLRKLSELDTLTNIFNRNAFQKMLDDHVANGEPFALLFADVKNFGLVNRREGHAMGDMLLVTTAQFLTSQLREDDGLVYRWGGDEFCIILSPYSRSDVRHDPDLTLEDRALAVSERLKTRYKSSFAVNSYNTEHLGDMPLELAINHAIWSPGMDSADLVNQADPKYNQ